MSRRSDFRGPVRCRESLKFTAKWRATVFLAGSRPTEVVWWRGSAPHGGGRARPHTPVIIINSAMNPNAARDLDPPTIESATRPTMIKSTNYTTMTRPNRLLSDWRISVLVLIALWAVIYMAGLSRPALLDDADTVHAEAAREMLQRHDWVTLYVNGIRYLEKAPLMYWGVATSYELFGVHDWSTRLPLMLGILAWLLAAYALGRHAYGERGGFYSAIVLATVLGPYLFTRFLIPDTLVGLWLI